LPDSLANLSNLRFLDLRANQLTSLTEALAALPRLEKLDLRWNLFSSLPGWLGRLSERGCLVYA
jgi:Leucine-rich repeat (LRR) protein